MWVKDLEASFDFSSFDLLVTSGAPAVTLTVLGVNGRWHKNCWNGVIWGIGSESHYFALFYVSLLKFTRMLPFD